MVIFHYFFYYGQPHPGSAVLSFPMQTGEHLKDFISILLLKANTIILYQNNMISCTTLCKYACRNINFWRFLYFAILKRIAKQILKKLLQLSAIALHRWQFAHMDDGFLFCYIKL